MTENRATLEIIAPTVEEAIEKGLADLGLSEDNVNVEILDEGSQGLFGLGSRQARIMLIVRGASDPEENTVPEPELVKPSAKVETASQEIPTLKEDNYLLEIAQGIISDLLVKMKLEDTKVKVYLGEPYGPHDRIPIHADISGNDLSILIGHRGETLDSLQYIARLMLGKELEQAVPLVIDVEGYRHRREKQIRRLARSIADQVVQSNRSQSLEPMPANERRLAHLELQADKEVYTESSGVGRHRKVVIFPQK